MGGAKLLKWRLAAEGAKLLKSGAALILSIPRWHEGTFCTALQLSKGHVGPLLLACKGL